MEKTQIGLTGEYYVLAQLEHRGFLSALTLSNTKGVDILVTNPDVNRLYKVEVKTTNKVPGRESLFGDKPVYVWAMSQKHESIKQKNLYYVFVYLSDASERPRFFVVNSLKVAKYVKWQHQYWLSTRTHRVKTTPMRRFRIPIDDPDRYEDNWNVFRK